MSEPFLGEISMFGGNFAPRGWAFCQGQLLPIAQNSALFSLLGTTYGGDGRTTLGLPDLRGRTPLHPGNGPGLPSYRLGQKGGEETVTLTTLNMAPHSHTLGASGDDNQSASPIGAIPGLSEDPQYRSSSDTQMAADGLTAVGGDGPHNNMQPFLTINFIIALVGLYPSRS